MIDAMMRPAPGVTDVTFTRIEKQMNPGAHGGKPYLIAALLAHLTQADGTQDPAGDNMLADTAASFLTGTDTDLAGAVQADRAATVALVDLLSRTQRRETLAALLANLELDHGDEPLLRQVIDAGLGGNFAGSHRWIAEDDIVSQRLEMIRGVVLPYLARHHPEKRLFLALKQHEARALAGNLALLDEAALDHAIAAGRGLAAPLPAVAESAAAPGARILLPNRIFNVLLRLAWTAPDYVADLADRYPGKELLALLATLESVVPVYLIPTHLGYPMGGGESFLHQTCRILGEFGVQCIWQSFLDPHTGWYTTSSLTQTPYYLDVRYAGGCSKEAIQDAIDQFHPDLIHAQGGTSDVAMELAAENRLTTMIGYHFWNGLVDLGETGNKHILDNIGAHALRTGGPAPSHLVHKYVASEFMQDVYQAVGGKEQLQVIHPISDAAQFLARRDGLGEYVLQVNVVPGKGGVIFLDCLKALGSTIPFFGVQSEPGEADFFTDLNDTIAANPRSRLVRYGNVREFYRQARIVIVPTLVDETFCRVAFEAAMNGIPVLCTANGYLPAMLGETGVFLSEDSADWIAEIAALYHDEARLRAIGAAQQARLAAMFGSDFNGFIASAMGLVDRAATRNIGIFTVWGDLGLGNLSHAHAKLLRSAGYQVHIFSFQPYGVMDKALVRQNDPRDWSVPEHADSVYYSFNHREEVSAYELRQFVLAKDIHTLLVPEICWQPNWDRLFALGIPGLKICAIPMIEIVVDAEIASHNRLTQTMYSTRLAQQVLEQHGVTNGAFLGFGMGRPLPPERIAAKRARLMQRDRIRYLHVAGHNPTTRKNTPQVIAAFAKALALRDDIELTVTSMDPVESYYPDALPAGITVIDRSLGREEILDLYEQHDVSIQVSSHEGLGLGFYESIARGTPVLSLDAAPHNEVVLEGRTGWLVPARPLANPDNNRSVVSAWQFDTFDLTDRIVELKRDQVETVTALAPDVFKRHFDEVALLTRFLQVLPRRARAHGAAPAAIVLPPDAALATDALVPDASVVPEPRPAWTARRIAWGVLRRVRQVVRPITSRVGLSFRNLVTLGTEDMRRELRTLAQEQAEHNHDLFMVARTLHDEVRMLGRSVAGQDAALGSQRGWLAVERAKLADLAHAQSQQSRELFGVASMLREQIDGVASQQAGLHALATQVDDAVNRLARQLEQHDDATADRGRRVAADLHLLQRETRFIKSRLASYAGPGVVLTYLRDESPIFVNTGDLGCPSPIVNGGVWEPENLAVLQSFVRHDTVFLDIGANVGYFSVAVGNRIGTSGQVYAYEPHPELTALIKRSIHLNSLERKVQVTQCALSDRPGTLELFYPDDHLGRGTAARTIAEAGRTLAVDAAPLDALVPDTLVADLVKIDVEGFELPVLRGMLGLLRRSPNVKLLFEKLESGNADNAAIRTLLLDLDLALYGVGPDAVLQPLDAARFAAWVGDVLAAPAGAVTHLARNSFTVAPQQLTGTGSAEGGMTRYTAQDGGIVFFGPDWFLARGHWTVTLEGVLHAPLRLTLVEEHERVFAELDLAPGQASATFTVPADIAHFELRATLAPGDVVDLGCLVFQRS
jgi:FkbM family methyltransferase